MRYPDKTLRLLTKRCRDLEAQLNLKLKPIKKRERPFEYQLRDRLDKSYGIMFVKTKPTITGFPDRLAVGLGEMCLVEIKRKDEGLSDVQVIVHRDLAKRGIRVLVVFATDVNEVAGIIYRRLMSLARR